MYWGYASASRSGTRIICFAIRDLRKVSEHPAPKRGGLRPHTLDSSSQLEKNRRKSKSSETCCLPYGPSSRSRSLPASHWLRFTVSFPTSFLCCCWHTDYLYVGIQSSYRPSNRPKNAPFAVRSLRSSSRIQCLSNSCQATLRPLARFQPGR
jgi:hypothetical protein